MPDIRYAKKQFEKLGFTVDEEVLNYPPKTCPFPFVRMVKGDVTVEITAEHRFTLKIGEIHIEDTGAKIYKTTSVTSRAINFLRRGWAL